MKRAARVTLVLMSAAALAAGCRSERWTSHERHSANKMSLKGAWRAKIAFRDGALAGMKELEFSYAYNEGGTMTESSNYDQAANSTPPAYGIWKQLDAHTYQTKYIYYTTRAPGPAEAPAKGDWWPAGHGVLTETITLAADGQTYTSTIKLVVYDMADQVIAGGGEGTGAGRRIEF